MKRVRRIRLVFLLLALALAALYAFPFIMVIINSVKERRDVANDPLSLPTTLKWSNFTEAIRKMEFWQSLGNCLAGAREQAHSKANRTDQPSKLLVAPSQAIDYWFHLSAAATSCKSQQTPSRCSVGRDRYSPCGTKT